MKRSLFFIAFMGCIALSFAPSGKKSSAFLNGTWDEYWGVEMGSDVSDVDRLEIVAVSPKDITIRCTTSDHFTYTKVKYSKKTLSFTMQNMSSGGDPFFVYYKLKRVNDDLIKGMIENSEGTKTDVQLKRVVTAN